MTIKWNGEENSAGYTDALTNAEYHSQKWAVSSSYLKTMLHKGQAAALAQPGPETPSMRLGTAIHTLVLEGQDAFDAAYAVQPEGMDFRTKAGKEWKAEQERMDLTVLSQSERHTVDSAYVATRAYGHARELLEDARIRERSLFWQDRETRVWCRARPDAYGFVNGHVVLADLKTCANLDTFETDLFKYAYDVQGAFYLRGLYAVHDEAPEAFGAPEFWLLAVETAKPHRVGLYTVDPFAMANADELIDTLLAQVALGGVQGGNSQEVARYRQMDEFTGNRCRMRTTAPVWVERERADYMAEALKTREVLAAGRRPF